MDDSTNDPSFEESMAELEQLVGRMESGEAGLTRLIEAFERGSQLVRICRSHLAKAELKIEQLESPGADEL